MGSRREHCAQALNAVTPQPLHRSLGLTDGELERIQELLERDPNDFELAVYSLLWSEHCGYKHSRLLLRRFPTRGRARAAGPGRERRRDRRRRRPRRRAQGREPQPPVGGRAVPGRRDRRRRHPARHLRDGRPADRDPRLAALRRARRRPPAAPVPAASSPASATTATASASPTSAARSMFDDAYEHNCLVNAMCVGVLPAERLQSAAAAGRRQPGGAVRVAHRPRRHRRRERARLAGLRRGLRRPSARGADRRPVHRQEADRVHARRCSTPACVVSLQDLGAAGLASSTAEMAASGGVGLDIDLGRGAAARGRHGAVRDHDLGVAGADGGDRRARARWTRCWRCARAGTSTPP